MTATKIQPGDDTHLTLLMAPYSLNFVTGADRAALLSYGRDVFAAARASQCLAQIEEPAGAATAAVAPLPAVLEQIAQGWDGCKYDAPGETLDIGADIRAAAKRLLAAAAPALEAPAAPMREVLTDGQITDALWRTHLRWMEQCGIDTEGMRPTGTWLEHWLIYARAVERAALAAAPQAPAAPRVVFADWEMEDRDPVEMLDKIYAVYQRSMGKPAPDAEMAEVVELTKDMLLAWWGEHREDIRAAMAAAQGQTAGAAPVGDLEGWAIDKSTGTDILVYKGCSVIEDEHAHRLLALLSAAPAAPAVDAWLQPDDMAALQRFHETAEDDESYDIGKEAVARLCAFGCLQSHSFGRYSTTDFGDYLLDTWAGARTLPFSTAAERRDRAAQAKEGGA